MKRLWLLALLLVLGCTLIAFGQPAPNEQMWTIKSTTAPNDTTISVTWQSPDTLKPPVFIGKFINEKFYRQVMQDLSDKNRVLDNIAKTAVGITYPQLSDALGNPNVVVWVIPTDSFRVYQKRLNPPKKK